MKMRLIILLVIASYSIGSGTVINIPGDYPNIQYGINASTNGDTVLVHPGTYIENLNYNGKNITVASLYISTLDTSFISTTIIDGSGYDMGIYGSCVSFHTGETHQAQLIGFTITNGSGNAWFVWGIPALYGGGIFVQNASPTLHHLRIQHNRGEINGSLIRPGAGGGLSIDNSNAVIHDIEFLDNSACTPDWDAPCAGGAVYIVNCQSLAMTNVSMFSDTACSFGGAVAMLNSNVDLINCLIVGNHCYNIGGAIGADMNSSVGLINCTVVDNHSGYPAGGGIYITNNTELQIMNSIFWMNTPYEMALVNNFAPTSTSVSYSDIDGGIDSVYIVGEGSFDWLEGNISADPMFVDPDSNDFHLQAGSPCIDAGDPSSPYDPDGTIADMGCFYYNQQTATAGEAVIPLTFNLSQNYPNPFNARTTIRFILPEAGIVQLTIYDLLGRQVQILTDGYLQAGSHTITFDASDLSSGVYFYRLQGGDIIKTKRMLFLK